MANITRLTAIVASTAAAGLGGAVIAGAADSGSATGTTSTTPGKHDGRGHGGPRGNETALTGDTKTKVEAAALAKVPGGTIVRSETDEGGVYEAHVKKSDGTEVEVKVDKDFKVTAVNTRPAGGPGGRGGRGPGGHGGPGMRGDLTAIAKALDVTEAKLQSALEAARPDKATAKGDRGATVAAAIAKSLGESTSDVTTVLESLHGDHQGPGGGRGRGPGGFKGGDDTALVAALVKKFSVSKDKAQAAVDAARKAGEAEHTARETARYAAVAKALGKDADDVKKAFEANRPVKPAPTTP